MSTFTDKAKSIIAAVAPTVGTALGGPFGALAGTVLAKALGTTDEAATAASIAGADPETLLKLKQAELDFKTHMAELGIKPEQLANEDRASARAREVAVRDTTPRNLAYMVIGFTGLMIGATMLGFTKVESALAGTLVGYLVAECRSALTYYFGSSQGSKDKDDALSTIAKMP